MLSLCSGIGGADLAAEWTEKIEIVGQVERDPYCCAVLTKHWPEVKRLKLLEEVQGDEFGPVDIIVAGIPCQPFSTAGKQQGEHDNRNLWTTTSTILRSVRPRWFVLENVQAFLSAKSRDYKGQFFGSIISDMAALGYSIGWGVWGACDVGAPHRRKRVFLVAYTTDGRQQERQETERLHTELDSPSTGLAYTTSGEDRRTQLTRIPPNTQPDRPAMAHPDNTRSQERQRGQYHQKARSTTTLRDDADTRYALTRMGGDTSRIPYRMDEHRWPARPGQEQYEWEPARTITGKLQNRVARLKALGNAIVPQQIYPLLGAIVEEDERRMRKHEII